MKMIRDLAKKLDRIFLIFGREADFAAGVLFVLGLMLIVFALSIDLHQVEFTGKLNGEVEITDPDENSIVTKQVGYILAPNWALTGFILLPLAIRSILISRAAVELTIESLVQRRMIKTLRFEDVKLYTVIEKWQSETRRYAILACFVFICVAGFIIVGDFFPVVAKWIFAADHEISEWVVSEDINILHPKYEFDWSIATIFNNVSLSPTLNFIFSLSAYLIIAVFGAAFLFSAFIWFISLASFFSPYGLRRHGLMLVPDINSQDPRRGFEVFEPLFHQLVLATIFTSVIAVSMHLQNVYLRAPNEEWIIGMIFGDTFPEILSALKALNFGELLGVLTSVNQVLQIDISAISPQTYISAIALFLLSAIVFTCIWAALRESAKVGAINLTNFQKLGEEEQGKLDTMEIWPVGWISINLLVSLFLVIALCMAFVNFISFVLLFFLIRALAALGSYVKERILPGA